MNYTDLINQYNKLKNPDDQTLDQNVPLTNGPEIPLMASAPEAPSVVAEPTLAPEPQLPQQPPQSDLEAALASKDSMLRNAGLLQGALQIGQAIAGGQSGKFKPDYSGVGLLGKRAQEEVKNVETQRKAKLSDLSQKFQEMKNQSAKLGLANKEKANDPNSAYSKSIQELSIQKYPEYEQMIQGRSATELEGLLQQMKKPQDNMTPYQKYMMGHNEELLKERKAEEARRVQAQKDMINQQQINTARGFLKDDPRFKKATEQGMAFDDVNHLINLARSGNQAAVAALGTKLARAMGEVGVLTDTDVVRYVAGKSWGRKLKDYYLGGMKGEISPETLKDITNNIGELSGKLKGDISRVYHNASSRMHTAYPTLPEHTIKGLLGYTTFGETEKSGEVKRKTKDGRIAIFDRKTKKFLRYEQ